MAVALVNQQPARSEDQLREQMYEIEAYLAAELTDDDRYATVSPGWRPKRWLNDRDQAERLERLHERRQERLKRGETPPPEPDRSPHPRETPRYQSEVDSVVDEIASRWPLYMRQHLHALLLRLPYRERMSLELHCRAGYSFEQIAVRRWAAPGLRPGQGWSDTAICLAHKRALEQLARAIWDDTGTPRAWG